MSTWSYLCAWGRGHSLTLDQGHSDFVLNIFKHLLRNHWKSVKFHLDPSWDGGPKVCSNDPGHMAKRATMPIYDKKLLLWNQLVDIVETWYTASGTRLLPSLFKWWHFYSKVNFGFLCICFGFLCICFGFLCICMGQTKWCITQKLLKSVI